MSKCFIVKYKYISSPWYQLSFDSIYQVVAFVDCMHSNEWFDECDVYIDGKKLKFSEQEELIREYKPMLKADMDEDKEEFLREYTHMLKVATDEDEEEEDES